MTAVIESISPRGANALLFGGPLVRLPAALLPATVAQGDVLTYTGGRWRHAPPLAAYREALARFLVDSVFI